MKIGISSSCFYPENTLTSLEKTLALGAPVAEIFLNTFRELEPDFVNRLYHAAAQSSGKVISIHPFTSAFEPFLFFSEYEGRLEDGLAIYRRYFEVCQKMGASILVFHGNTRGRKVTMEQYAKSFCRLAAEGEKYGITVAQENVDRCQCGDPAAVEELKRYADRPVKFALDLKQCRRYGCDIMEMARAMGPENICHLHLSDCTLERPSALPGAGSFDFKSLFAELQRQGCRADAVVELYRGDYGAEEELRSALAYLNQQI